LTIYISSDKKNNEDYQPYRDECRNETQQPEKGGIYPVEYPDEYQSNNKNE
jgi:hypothetical protein